MYNPLPIRAIEIDDRFWNRYTHLIPDVALPYQWEILNDRVPDAPASYCLRNFRIAAGLAEGARQGAVFQDSDAYKWLEAVAYSLAARPDETLEKNADEVIALIGAAQCADGYLNTYFTLLRPEDRWLYLAEGHELYCAGHLFEAAAAYFEATGKRALLTVACRFADLICAVFGPEEGKLHGYPGHPEIELALVRLFETTGKREYLRLAKYFLDVRGGLPNYFLEEMARPGYRRIYDEFRVYDPAYAQSHLPPREQATAEGHAVRAVYLYCAMADIARHYGDETLQKQCEALWRNITDKRMYLTGSVGSSGFLERFTTDYDLPGDSGYAETCASIGLARFGLRMARLTGDAAYMDTVERVLYNAVRAGISFSGDRYFYVNPLEVWPAACMEHTSRAHVKAVRQKWFDVACCPTNIARTLTSLGQFIYTAAADALSVNLFIQNRASFTLGGKPVRVEMIADYPKEGLVRLKVDADNAAFTLRLRLPAFAENPALTVNGHPAPCETERGYCVLSKVWNRGDTVALSFDIRPRLIFANPLVRANAGKVAIARGPEVYCLEETDNGENLAAVVIRGDVRLRAEWDDALLGGTLVIRLNGEKLRDGGDGRVSYSSVPNRKEAVALTAVPYGSWNNRGAGEMIVWMRLSL